MSVRLQFRRGTASQWTNADPTLFAGEVGIETDTRLIKIGDGTTPWTSLVYATVSPVSLVEQAQDAVNTALVAGTGLDKTYNDGDNTITIDIDSTVATKTYADTAVSTHSSDSTSVHGITDTTELATKAFAAELLTNSTKTNITITGDKTGLVITAENGVADSTTDNLTEGSTNKYFTDERAQDAIGNSVGAGLSYNDTTGAVSVDTTTIQARVTDVSDTEIGYLNGVTSGIQTQIDGKASLSGATFTGAVSGTSLTLSGDLTVNGTTTNLNSTNLVIEDKNIVLGDTETPTDTTADGGGITLKGATDKTFAWADATDSWTSSEHIAVAAGKEFKGNVTGNLTGVINGSVSGNASTATTLETSRNINGVAFNGSANITVTADANTLSGTELKSTVVTSALTTVGTIGTGTWNATTIALDKGGTGQTTAEAARNALLPTQAENANKVLKTDGTNVSWTDGPTLQSLTVNTNDLDVGSLSNGLRTTDDYTNPISVFSIDADDDYAQLAIKNTGNGANSSTDVILYSDNGDDTAGWSDLGFTGSNFSDPGFTITGANDGYFFVEAPVGNVRAVSNKELTSNIITLTTSTEHEFSTNDEVVISGIGAPFDGIYIIAGTPTATTFTYAKNGTNVTSAAVSPAGEAKVATGDGNLVLATGGNGARNKIVFAAGGLSTDNTQMEITPDVNVHIEIPTPSTSSTTGALTVDGGVGIQGDLFLEGDLDVDGDVDFSGVQHLPIGGNAFAFSETLTNPVITAVADKDDYQQIAFKNESDHPNASTDFIAYADNGTDEDGYIDMGITSSTFSDPSFTVTGENDGYIFMVAPDGTTGNGDLVLATGDTGARNAIVFAAGGLASNNTQMTITPDVNVHIEIDTPSTSPSTGALTVEGGVGIQGDMNIEGNVSIEGTITFGGSGTTVETANLNVTDPAVFVGTNNQADIVDLAFIGEYATTISTITKTVSNKALTDNVATLTTSEEHTYLAGDVVIVTDVDGTFNGTFNIIDVPTTTTFTYAKTAANVTSVSASGSAAVSARRKFAGIARDASDGVTKVFKDATTKPTSTINFSEAGVGYGDFQVGAFTASSATIGDVSNTELQYLNGVTSAIQTQLNGKLDSSTASTTYAPINNPVFTGTVSVPTSVVFEGATDNESETTLTVVDPTADRTITFPDATGTVSLVANTETLTNKSIALSSNTITGTLSDFNTALTDADFATVAGAQTLTNKTLTTPVISTISNTGTITLPTSTDTLVGRATTDTLTNKTLTAAVLSGTTKVQQLLEKATISATAATGTVAYDVLTNGSVTYYTSNATGNWTLNVRGDGSNTLNSIMATGDSLTIAFAVTQGTAYYATAFQIDGSAVTPKWQDAAPTSGNASSIDMYAYTIMKTGNAAYTVFASRSKFA
jgi:cytoskeletal protein CcmA (bactofilin family)